MERNSIVTLFNNHFIKGCKSITTASGILAIQRKRKGARGVWIPFTTSLCGVEQVCCIQFEGFFFLIK